MIRGEIKERLKLKQTNFLCIRNSILAMICYLMAGLGITAGAHRLWSHRCYKARWPLKYFLLICNCMSFQNHVIEWSRDHRCHHKVNPT
jgi:stearoyl-CoA desaturase (delta-9 desaturase)